MIDDYDSRDPAGIILRLVAAIGDRPVWSVTEQ
jgi:hypothetical protein